MRRVLIRGDGIAALCCEHLLKQAGFEVGVEASGRVRIPAIMLSEAAVHLIRDVFAKPDLFRELPQLQKRVVAWGTQAAAITLEHSAVVVSEEFLLASVNAGSPGSVKEADWTIYTSRPLPPEAQEHRFGKHVARASPVTLRGESGTCWMESMEAGWLFLVPNSEGHGWLLSVGDASLAGSRVIAEQVAEVQAGGAQFPAYPRMMSPLCGPDWIACGTAAIGFDPICGDGTANAVREAILAAAVITAARDGGDVQELLQHYESRLRAGFLRHLALSYRFYRTGSQGAWWAEEVAALQRGLDWIGDSAPQFRYQLNGFQLQRVR